MKEKEKGMTPQRLEAVLRHYYEFLALYEDRGIDEITMDDGTVVNILDLLRGIEELPERQKEALVLTCLMNLRERDAARIMGFPKWSSPVGTYKKLALARLIERYWRIDAEEED